MVNRGGYSGVLERGVCGKSLPPSQFVVNLKLLQKRKKHTHSGEAAAVAGTKLPTTLLFRPGHGHLVLIPGAPV